MLNILKTWLVKYWQWPVLILLSVVFFLGTASFSYYAQSGGFIKWGSPDESANYIFTKLYAQEKQLSFFEKYNLVAADIIHPRSYLSDQGWLKPSSFIGMILIYGQIASLTTYKILPYLTPAFAAIGLIFYFLLLQEIFDRRNAFISTLALSVFPPFVYYSARSLFHNVLLVVFLIISFYFAVLIVKRQGQKASPAARRNFKLTVKPTDIYVALSGLFLGLTIMVRPSELIWLVPAWLVLWLFNLKRVGFTKLIIFIAFLVLAILPAAYWNTILYQSYWRGGYQEMNQSILNIAGAGQEIIKAGAGATAGAVKDNLLKIKNNVFYFGFSPLKSFKVFYFYFARMFYWLFWPAVLGSLWFLLEIKKWQKRHYAYLLAYAAIFFILLFYYGSWDFHDNPDPKSRTIGNSYTRYWLPIYLGAMPLASFFLIKLSEFLRKKFLIYGFRALILAIVFFVSLKFVLIGSAEGLSQSLNKQLATRTEYNRVLSLTEANSIIITQYHDKLFFPQRKVIVGLFNDANMIKQYANLTNYLPVYYYNFTFPEKDFNYLNNKRLAEFDLQIRPVAAITKDFTLYRLESLKLNQPAGGKNYLMSNFQ